MKKTKDIKNKKEFRHLPNSIIKRVSKLAKEDIKESRAILRKYFGVFLTNKILKEKTEDEDRLKNHISSKKRNYEEFYKKIFEDIQKPNSIIDLGCGVNGFSYKYLKELFPKIKYTGIEAAGQLVNQMNSYFKKESLNATAINEDLFNTEKILKILKNEKQIRVVFMFQVIDALENLEKNFSKEFIKKISKECEIIILSLPTENFGGRRKIQVKRNWITKFLEDNFKIISDFEISGERIIIFEKM
jgi:isochorismate hydrolase